MRCSSSPRTLTFERREHARCMPRPLWRTSRETTRRRGRCSKSSSPSAERSVTLLASCRLSTRSLADESFIGNLKSARSLFEECLRLSQEAGSELTVAQSLANLAYILKEDGDLTGAKALAEQALAIFVRLKDFAGAAWLQSRLGDLEREQGNAGVARVWYERALAMFEKLGDRTGLARTMIDLAGGGVRSGTGRQGAYDIGSGVDVVP